MLGAALIRQRSQGFYEKSQTRRTSKHMNILKERVMSAATPKSTIATPVPYEGFTGQYINGAWRGGRHNLTEIDVDPYTGETVAEISLANATDLDEAYRTAARSQQQWAARSPQARADVIGRSAEIMIARHDEIIDWLIRESGSTRVKAEEEWKFTLAITQEAATFPHRIEGRLLSSDAPGKESRAYRQPLGVVGVH